MKCRSMWSMERSKAPNIKRVDHLMIVMKIIEIVK
jgi:hypothetical protein